MTAFTVKVSYSPTSPPVWVAACEGGHPANATGCGTTLELALAALGRYLDRLDRAALGIDDVRFPVFDRADRLRQMAWESADGDPVRAMVTAAHLGDAMEMPPIPPYSGHPYAVRDFDDPPPPPEPPDINTDHRNLTDPEEQ